MLPLGMVGSLIGIINFFLGRAFSPELLGCSGAFVGYALLLLCYASETRRRSNASPEIAPMSSVLNEVQLVEHTDLTSQATDDDSAGDQPHQPHQPQNPHSTTPDN